MTKMGIKTNNNAQNHIQITSYHTVLLLFQYLFWQLLKVNVQLLSLFVCCTVQKWRESSNLLVIIFLCLFPCFVLVNFFLYSLVLQHTLKKNRRRSDGLKQAMIPKPQSNVLFRIVLSFSLFFWQMHKKKMQMFLIFVCCTVHLK